MSNKTGGRAFPCDSIVERDEVGHLHGFEVSSGGMTLRDYFAAACIAQLVTSPLRQEGTMEGDVRYAYKIADAMLEARK